MKQDSLDDEIGDLLAKEIQREIDEGILSNILVETGWTAIPFTFKDNFQAVDINNWLDDQCENKWRRLGGDYVFADKKDAEWFILRWS